jgi:hypothetical protein
VYCRLVLVLIPSSNFIALLLIQVSVKSGEGHTSQAFYSYTVTMDRLNNCRVPLDSNIFPGIAS